MVPAPALIRVKLLWKSIFRGGVEHLIRRFPNEIPVWGGCQFIFDPEALDYDWLVVYDDMPLRYRDKVSKWNEILPCPRERTIFITAEPSTIKTYGRHFLAQFGHVLTSQEPWVIRHPGAIFSQAALLWFYGRTDARGKYEQMRDHPPLDKSAVISTVCSAKQQTHTLHRTRYEFTRQLRTLIPEMDVFGHGVRPITDKADALDAYRYHIVIENHVCMHHWTEKLSDAFLGHCLPFYHGCPNAVDYFPEDSFIRIDIHRVEESAERIRQAIRDNEYERRLPAIREARSRVLADYGLFAVVTRIIEEKHEATAARNNLSGQQIIDRHAMRRLTAGNAISYLMEYSSVRLRHAMTRAALDLKVNS
jgi:hypothetical protein